ncbi:hypothetical protein Leryth_012728 [Lithospermum erythrorhizon]|nr:hypothetical protein Leryth_012728 [Lithospermum erythrorhizon]
MFSATLKPRLFNFNINKIPFFSASSACTTLNYPNKIPFSSASSACTTINYPELQESSSSAKPWSGLTNWRQSLINHNRLWGPKGPQEEKELNLSKDCCFVEIQECCCLAEIGALVLSTPDPLKKSKLSHLGFCRWLQQDLPIGVCDAPLKPARPAKPQLVPIKEVPTPKTSSLPLNAYMLHNLAHVELNAIDLAWDTVVRFSPYSHLLHDGFFVDFAHVADEESRHFAWCSQRLAELGFSYGDMPAHNLLWRESEKSADNVAARLAAIPLVQEARGLDAGPRLVQKLVGFGDLRTSNIVARIADEEIAHVAVGLYWFLYVCQKMNCAPCSTFKDLLMEYNVEVKGPFNHPARNKAGIPQEWYDSTSTQKAYEKDHLSMVHDRLACIISMEKENSSITPTK